MLLVSQMLQCHRTTRLIFSHQARRRAVIFLLASLVVVSATVAAVSASREQTASPAGSNVPPAIVIGFMGGRVPHDDAIRNELIISNRLRAAYPHGVYFEVFENRRVEDAHQKILRLLGGTPGRTLTEQQKRGARIVLYGHSWGAAAVVALAHALQKDAVPVALTIQVDSIRKPGVDDTIVPANVLRAINFYQTVGMLHGHSEIHAADPAHTQILGNFRFSYNDAPQECSQYPWFERMFIKKHIAIECDPVLWKRIETLIRDTLGPPAQESAAR